MRHAGLDEVDERSGYRVEPVDWDDPRARAMRDQLDHDLLPRYLPPGAVLPAAVADALGVDPADVVVTLLASTFEGAPAGHAALQRRGDAWEVKRVIVRAAHRRRGVAGMLMRAVHAAATDAGADRLILQTGGRQPEAEAFYRRLGYEPIPVYPPYDTAIPESRCFARTLSTG